MTAPTPSTTELSTYQGTWTLDPARTTVNFATKAVWILPVKGTFAASSGAGSVGPDGALTGSVVFDAASVATGIKKRDAHLRDGDFFDVANHPTFEFTVTGATARGAGKVELSGTLTIRGESRPLTVPAEVVATETEATFTGTLDIDRSAWGLSWKEKGAGMVNHVTVTATFTKD